MDPLDLEHTILEKRQALYELQQTLLQIPRSERPAHKHKVSDLDVEIAELTSLWADIGEHQRRLLEAQADLLKSPRAISEPRMLEDVLNKDPFEREPCTPSPKTPPNHGQWDPEVREILGLRRELDEQIAMLRIKSPLGCSLGTLEDRVVLFRRSPKMHRRRRSPEATAP
eukprot:TRINITY_DN1315_c0_g1_i3.p1 TRINITY_DN1315_c0_g1~~TRINITY_DN1315_c0_g1_i3.p1  ORF type:complete len:170 (+),score=32.53 TRINITY_DN1315_c0_g1_i3:241-750(+)